MLGGLTITDNTTDSLLERDVVDWDALVYTPPERAYSADADTTSCKRLAPIADLVAELTLDVRYGETMTVNGFAFCGALGFPADPLLEALPDVAGVSLSGTGPSYVAVADSSTLDHVAERWADRDGTLRRVQTRTDGTQIVP